MTVCALSPKSDRENHEKTPTTVALIRAIQRGEGEEAWRCLYDRYAPELLDYARLRVGRHLRSRVAAADLVQEALLRAVRKLMKLPHVRRGAFRDLLRCDIWRVAAEIGREKGERRNAVVAMADVQIDPQHCAADQRSASSMMALEEDVARLHDAIQKLSLIYRRVILMVDIDGLSTREASVRLNQKHDTTRRQLHRARSRLRELMVQG